jgi:hypothetical protein
MLTVGSSGGDRAGNADIYAASGCPSTCVGMFSFLEAVRYVNSCRRLCEQQSFRFLKCLL